MNNTLQKLQEYFSQLSKRDRILLGVVLGLFSFVIFKLVVIDGLNKHNNELNGRAKQVQEHSILMQSAGNLGADQRAAGLPSNQVITNFLKQNNISEKLKQIRTTNKGEQRFEIEDIGFSQLLELLRALDKNGSNYSSVQIKNRKIPGLVNTILILEN